jgi:hypothetical protein
LLVITYLLFFFEEVAEGLSLAAKALVAPSARTKRSAIAEISPAMPKRLRGGENIESLLLVP